MSNPTRPNNVDIKRLRNWIESLAGPVDAVTAAGYANDLSPWPTETPEWHLFIRALSDGLDAPGAALALVERVLPGCHKCLIESSAIMATRGKPFACDLYDTTGPDGQQYGRHQGVGWEAEGAGSSFPIAILSALLSAIESNPALAAIEGTGSPLPSPDRR